MEDNTQIVTIELPLNSNAVDKKGITVDCLFTALDHARSYHNYEGNYDTMYENLDNYIYRQISEQIE